MVPSMRRPTLAVEVPVSDTASIPDDPEAGHVGLEDVVVSPTRQMELVPLPASYSTQP
jgi:hypothetical protein